MADQQRAVRRVLSIDGGGIRGIIPALVLAHPERQVGAPASEFFDLIVGTSTGGILALGLSLQDQQGRSPLAAKRMVALYERHGPKIFERSLWRKLRTAGGSSKRPIHTKHLRRSFINTLGIKGWVTAVRR